MEQAHVIEVKNLQQDEPTDYSVCTTYRACVARWKLQLNCLENPLSHLLDTFGDADIGVKELTYYIWR
jgi:hypothetical protein